MMYKTDRDENYYDIRPEYFNNKRMEPPADYGEDFQKEETASLDSEGKQKSFIRLCERFAEKTSMQGLPYINAAKLKYAKVLWVLILLGGIAGMTLHLYYLIDQFTDFDVQVDLKLGFSNLAFPAITICNVNAVRNSQLHKTSEKLLSLVAQTDPKKLKTASNKRRRKKRYVDNFDIDFDNYTKDFSNRGGEKDQTSQITDTFKTLYMELDRNTREKVGHKMKDMLLQCSFAGYKCWPENFTLVQTEEYGNCYTIQSTDLTVANPGPANGLSLTLYMETEEYLTGINQGFGARLLIHETGTYPFPSEEGIYAHPNFLVTDILVYQLPTSLEVHKNVVLNETWGKWDFEIIRKGNPYGTCADVATYKQQYGATYTRTLCQVFCKQNEIIDQCGCFDNSIKDVYDALNSSIAANPCKSDTEKRCLADITEQQESVGSTCEQCINPCQETKYARAISSRSWPTDEYANVLMEGMCERIPDKCTYIRAYETNNDLIGLGKNFVKIVVYFEDLNYELIEETPAIETQQFASDVGGAVGLWIGLSLISLFEVFQLLLECCAFGVHKCRQPKKDKSKLKYKEKSSSNAPYNRNNNTSQIPRIEMKNGYKDSYNKWNSRV